MKKSAHFLRGFTLVELLVVIAIIGVLAAVLLIGINPIEQMNKARDAGKLSNAKEVISAAERYYAARNTEPGTCAVLETAQELKSGVCGSGATLVVLGGLGTTLYTATFTPASRTYREKCTCLPPADPTNCCLVPDEFR